MAQAKQVAKESTKTMLAVVRIKGRYNLRTDFDETMKLMHLPRVHHCVVIPNNDVYAGMVHKVKDLVTWGEVDAQTFARMIEKRARLSGDKRLNEAWLKEKKIASFEALAKDVMAGKIDLRDLGIKPVFRLTPPSKGMKSSTRIFPKGDLGYRGPEINEYLQRCI